jgi:predicted nuclease of predicted toxin-antitoxin system
MRLLADMRISPRTVQFLRALGHDVVRVSEALPINSADEEIVEHAIKEGRTVLTQDLGFSDRRDFGVLCVGEHYERALTLLP